MTDAVPPPGAAPRRVPEAYAALPPLQRAAAVMDRLRSPGGCPWDAEQTHRSLARYLLEETYEVLEAIETDDPVLLREELGDVLLQVLFHARLAEERGDGHRFGVDDVAADLAAKLVRRHPHVFAEGAHGSPDGPATRTDADAVNEAWERGKIAEKQRASATDGVPTAQPALALAAKLVARARRAGLEDVTAPGPADDHGLGERLLALVREAVDLGVDPEGALRRVSTALREGMLAAEAAARPAAAHDAPAAGRAAGDPSPH